MAKSVHGTNDCKRARTLCGAGTAQTKIPHLRRYNQEGNAKLSGFLGKYVDLCEQPTCEQSSLPSDIAFAPVVLYIRRDEL